MMARFDGVGFCIVFDFASKVTQYLKAFLAHLSQRLIGELIGYSWSGVRPSSSSVRPSVVRRKQFQTSSPKPLA